MTLLSCSPTSLMSTKCFTLFEVFFSPFKVYLHISRHILTQQVLIFGGIFPYEYNVLIPLLILPLNVADPMHT